MSQFLFLRREWSTVFGAASTDQLDELLRLFEDVKRNAKAS
jgi:hypothetical protein